jgi:myosin heavy subunit
MNQLQSLDTQCLDSNISNLINLQQLTEKTVLYLLRIRFHDNHIYSYVSNILVAVNPFYEFPGLYSVDQMNRCRQTIDKRELSPHIFITANEAYDALLLDNVSQCLIISGESGSGKTESIKLILRYLTHITKRSDSSQRNIQEQILQANPVMEAFGNAKTSRNNNRSTPLASLSSSLIFTHFS